MTDGYAENCQQAIPWLIQQRIPCTYFVTVQNVSSGEPFAHDLMSGHRFAPNTLEQLRAMAAAGVEIGCHAYTHPRLEPVERPTPAALRSRRGQRGSESAIQRPVRYFAVPYGHYSNLSPALFASAKAAGYAGVCSAYGGFNFPGDDPFHLQRIAGGDDMIHLKNWATLDPRKLKTKRFEYKTIETRTPASEANQEQEEYVRSH